MALENFFLRNYDGIRKTELERQYGIIYSELPMLYHDSDIISLHCPLNENTNDLINYSAINQMKDGVILVNTARGGLVNVLALEEALISGKISFAALDVHYQEPIPNDYPLKKYQNVILTPHIAGVTEDSFVSMMREAFKNIVLFENGRTEEIEEHRYVFT